jgi:DNA-binding transcriptional LysR family regulator
VSIDLRHFRSFVIVAEEGNIGRAAQRLFITQPALSRQMQQLEREVGEALLLRTGRGVELTDAGRQLVDKARVALDAVEDALAAGSSQEPHGKLILGLPQAGGRDRWFGLAQAFADRHSGVEVEVREALSEHLQRQLLAGDLHAAIALTPSHLPSLRYTHLHDDRVWAWMRRDDQLAGRTELELADLDGRQVPLVGGDAQRGAGYNRAIRALFEEAGVRPRFVETLDVLPVRAVRTPGYVGLMVPNEVPEDVVGIPLVPVRTLAFELVERGDARSAAVRALAPFAADHLARAAASCTPGMSRA